MFKGNRTYITAAIALGLAVAKGVGFEVPEEIFFGLTALGFGFIRAGIENSK